MAKVLTDVRSAIGSMDELIAQALVTAKKPRKEAKKGALVSPLRWRPAGPRRRELHPSRIRAAGVHRRRRAEPAALPRLVCAPSAVRA